MKLFLVIEQGKVIFNHFYMPTWKYNIDLCKIDLLCTVFFFYKIILIYEQIQYNHKQILCDDTK